MSTAMMVLALTMRAAITAARPTEPTPKTAMLDPARTASEFITVPAPVCRPQPKGASIAAEAIRALSPDSAPSPECGWQRRTGQRSDRARRLAGRWSRRNGQSRSSLPKTARSPPGNPPARPAAAAGLVGEHHMVAWLESLTALPIRSTTPEPSCPSTTGPEAPLLAEINVGMANPAGHQAHQHLVFARAFHFQALDFQRAARLAQHGRSDGNDGLVRLFSV